MRIAVTGGRSFNDVACVRRTLDALHLLHPITELAHGGAFGADTWCQRWAKYNGVSETGERFAVTRAEWSTHGGRAGHYRNARMLAEFQPDLLVAFPGHEGTADCRRRADALGIRIVDAVVL